MIESTYKNVKKGTMTKATRWGIASAGKISSDFVTALAVSETKEQHQVVAIAARSEKSAQDVAAKFGIPRAYGGYEQLAKDPEIDVVYISVINPAHLAVVKLMLEHGKNILCEKPLGMNVKETKEMLSLAKAKGVFFMEAMWSWFNPMQKKFREELQLGRIGKVYQANVAFGLPIQDMERVSQKELGGGAILDIGVYAIYYAQLVYNGERPIKVVAGGHLNDNGVDESVCITLLYTEGRSASIVLHTRVQFPNEATVYGTEGNGKLHFPFWAPEKISFKDGEVTFEHKIPVSDKPFNFFHSAGLSYEAQHVRECLEAGLSESPVVRHEDTLIAAEIMDAVRKQVGVKYDQDE